MAGVINFTALMLKSLRGTEIISIGIQMTTIVSFNFQDLGQRPEEAG